MSNEPTDRPFPPNKTLQAFTPIIGTWKTCGTHGMIPNTTLHGETTFTWHESGAFIVMHTRIREDVGIPGGVALLASDDTLGTYVLSYYDERGVSRFYQVQISGKVITWWRTAAEFSQRTTLTLSDDGQIMVGTGEISKDGKTWEQDLDLTYSKA